MGEPLPLFPLGTVLFPGMALPLLVFEDRYRRLVADLLRRPEGQRTFGVVAIRDGYEVGDISVQSAHRVGCEAVVESIRERPDGRYELATAGRRRFRVDGMERRRPYLIGDVAYLAETDGADVDHASARALAAFEAYRSRLGELHGAEVQVLDLPRRARTLSYALAATGLFGLGDRQALLAEETTAGRLTRLADLFRTEVAAMTALPSLPATGLRTGWSPN